MQDLTLHTLTLHTQLAKPAPNPYDPKGVTAASDRTAV
jgi:hypothetical protein